MRSAESPPCAVGIPSNPTSDALLVSPPLRVRPETAAARVAVFPANPPLLPPRLWCLPPRYFRRKSMVTKFKLPSFRPSTAEASKALPSLAVLR